MAKEWIESHNGALLLDSGVVYAIVLKNTGQLIGSIGLSIIEEHQRAEMGYWIGKPYWNKGCATEAAGLVLHFGFHNLGLNRINASHLVRNPGSGRVMEKNGMKFEGCFRQHVKKWGVFEDLNYFAILKEDFID